MSVIWERVLSQKKAEKCPWCGKKVVYQESKSIIDVSLFQVLCNNSKCPIRPKTNLKETLQDCLTDWNRRKGE